MHGDGAGEGWTIVTVGGAARGVASHDADFVVSHPSQCAPPCFSAALFGPYRSAPKSPTIDRESLNAVRPAGASVGMPWAVQQQGLLFSQQHCLAWQILSGSGSAHVLRLLYSCSSTQGVVEQLYAELCARGRMFSKSEAMCQIQARMDPVHCGQCLLLGMPFNAGPLVSHL